MRTDWTPVLADTTTPEVDDLARIRLDVAHAAGLGSHRNGMPAGRFYVPGAAAARDAAREAEVQASIAAVRAGIAARGAS
jgi:hypothetical protein